MSSTLGRARRMTIRAVAALLTLALSATLASVVTASPAAATTPLPSIEGQRMVLDYTKLGTVYSAGWVDYRLSLDYNGRPLVYGAIMTVHPANGWNAVGYGSQTLVQCKNDLYTPDYAYSVCYVKVKMEKPGNVQGTINGSYKGVAVNAGYDSGSGRSYMFFTGKLSVYKMARDQPFHVCYNFGWLGCRSTGIV